MSKQSLIHCALQEEGVVGAKMGMLCVFSLCNLTTPCKLVRVVFKLLLALAF